MRKISIILLSVGLFFSCSEKKKSILVFQSDFGLKDGAVAAMKGVAVSVSNDLDIYDLTHEIPAYDISAAAYRLNQTCSYWPAGTVFVSIVDPGVGSERKSIVAKTSSGHYFVTPDNGTLTLISKSLGIEAVREIDETKNRLQGSSASYTFHGRDVYAYTGARLAAGVITFEEVGKLLEGDIVLLSGLDPDQSGDGILGAIPVLDVQYGNVWSNIDQEILKTIDVKPGDSITIEISYNDEIKYANRLLFGNTFSDVAEGKDVAYLNSLLKLSVAVNQGNFSEKYGVKSGEGWKLFVKK